MVQMQRETAGKVRSPSGQHLSQGEEGEVTQLGPLHVRGPVVHIYHSLPSKAHLTH